MNSAAKESAEGQPFGLPSISHNAYLASALPAQAGQLGGFGGSRTAEHGGTESRLTTCHQRVVESAQPPSKACQQVPLVSNARRPDSAAPATPESPGGLMRASRCGSTSDSPIPANLGGKGGLSLTPQYRPQNSESDVDPAALRASLEAYYQLLDACDALPPEGGLQGLIAKRVVRADLVAAIDTIRRKLSRIARRGGRGFPAKVVTP